MLGCMFFSGDIDVHPDRKMYSKSQHHLTTVHAQSLSNDMRDGLADLGMGYLKTVPEVHYHGLHFE